MWDVANDEATAHRDPGTVQFLTALSESIQATEKRTAATENRISELSWAILHFAWDDGVCAARG
jgi:hypothetical protein